MKRRFRRMGIAVIAALMMCMFVPTAMAAPGDTGVEGFFTWTELADGTAEVSLYTGPGGEVAVPSTIAGRSVSAIGDLTFNAQPGITKITIPEGISAIGASSFSGTGISSIELPASLRSIGDAAFAGTALTEVTIPAGLTSLGGGVFQSIPTLTEATFACDQVAFDFTAFLGCTAMEKVTFTGSWIKIPDVAFNGSLGLKTVVLPEGITTIGVNAFIGCISLDTINFPGTLKTIEAAAFNGCPSLADVTFPEGFETLGASAFAGAGFSEVVLPTTITDIGGGAFQLCPQLKKLVVLNPAAVFGIMVVDTTDINSDGIYGFAGSTAQTYANTNEIPFHVLQTIQFDSQGGSSVPNAYDVIGQTVDEPAAPTRDGYEFGGWYPTAACDTAPTAFPYTIAGDATLYAKWNEIYTVTFDSRGGSAVSSADGLAGDTVAKPADPSRDGYTFGGWYPTAACDTTQVAFPYTIAGDVTLYAAWTDQVVNPQTGDVGGGSWWAAGAAAMAALALGAALTRRKEKA